MASPAIPAAASTPSAVAAAVAPSAVDLLPALLRGAALVGVVGVGAWATGALPPGTEPYLVLGATLALAATGVAAVLHGRVMDRRFAASLANDPRLIAGRLQGLLAVGLLLKLLTVTVGVLWLRAAGVKFAAVATFAVAFAAASLVCQVTAAGSLVRAASRRGGVARDGAGPPTGERT